MDVNALVRSGGGAWSSPAVRGFGTERELEDLTGESEVWLRRKLNGLVPASLTDLAGWTYHLNKPEVWPVPNSIEDLMMPGEPRFRPTGRRHSAYR